MTSSLREKRSEISIIAVHEGALLDPETGDQVENAVVIVDDGRVLRATPHRNAAPRADWDVDSAMLRVTDIFSLGWTERGNAVGAIPPSTHGRALARPPGQRTARSTRNRQRRRCSNWFIDTMVQLIVSGVAPNSGLRDG
ncbi:MAG: hypothetical protein ACYDGR_08140 [Candidatus Dormibacteria bacterium]